MSSVPLTSNFFKNARGLTIADGGGVTWSFNKNTNTLTVSGLSGVGIAPGSVSNADLANMAANTLKGNNTAGPATPLDLTVAQAQAMLSVPGAANPTGSVGLTAANGTAATYMRSDAAPKLDVSIAPTWTGAHTFSGNTLTHSIAGKLVIVTPSAGSALTVNGFAAGTAITVTDGTVTCLTTLASATLQFGTASNHDMSFFTNDNTWLTIAKTGAITAASKFAINNGTPTAALSGFGAPSGTPTSGLTSSATL